MRNIYFIQDANSDIKIDDVAAFVNSKCKSIKIKVLPNIYKSKYRLISFPKTHKSYIKNFEKEIKGNLALYITSTPYDNNYFYEELDNFVIVSTYGWEDLTSLPKENGLLYCLCRLLINDFDDFRHEEETGCINDFLWNKTGIDDGMRQAALCKECLKRFSKLTSAKENKALISDIKILMNDLSSSSKWNLNILDNFVKPTFKKPLSKQKPWQKGIINVLIASPSDTEKERQILLKELERKFRISNYEKISGHRLIVHGWEDLASQPGYAQDVIDKKILSKVDIVVGIIKHKLGTPTKHPDGKIRAESGTAEEILFALDSPENTKTLGMLYFFSKPPNPSLEDADFNNIKNEWERVKKFKETIIDKIIYRPYATETDLLNMVCEDLSKNILDYYS